MVRLHGRDKSIAIQRAVVEILIISIMCGRQSLHVIVIKDHGGGISYVRGAMVGMYVPYSSCSLFRVPFV